MFQIFWQIAPLSKKVTARHVLGNHGLMACLPPLSWNSMLGITRTDVKSGSVGRAHRRSRLSQPVLSARVLALKDGWTAHFVTELLRRTVTSLVQRVGPRLQLSRLTTFSRLGEIYGTTLTYQNVHLTPGCLLLTGLHGESRRSTWLSQRLLLHAPMKGFFRMRACSQVATWF